jgi:Zn-dependent alcohol dehydrogenase
MKTKAAVCREFEEPISIEEIELEAPQANEILVKVAHTGWCHSDLSMLQGKLGMDIVPFVIGHECSGVVQEVGPGVTTLKPGDHVVSCWVAPCGHCERCVSGETHICLNLHPALQTGKLADGTTRMKGADDEELNHFLFCSGFSEYIVTPEISSVKVPKELPMDQACLLGCCVGTGWGSAVKAAKIEPGETVAVWGCGGIGLNVIQGARLSGASMIIGVDLEGSKEKIAREMGATHFINASEEDPVPIIREQLTNERGVDYVFEAIGDPGAFAQAFYVTRIGGTFSCIGITSTEDLVSWPPFMIVFGVFKIQGIVYGNIRHQVDIPIMADLALKGELKLDQLITERFKLEDINEVAKAMEKRQIVGRWVCDL